MTGECNDGAILAKSVGVEAGCYTSMLNVTIEQGMINKTIECVYDDLQTGSSPIIGQTTLKTTQGYSYNNIIITFLSKSYYA